LDLVTHAVTEEQLDDQKTEWPTINRHMMGRKSRYAYNSMVPHYEGLVKYDTLRGTSEKYLFARDVPRTRRRSRRASVRATKTTATS
jgi:carotenoid cleavage dioxygenase-like enzyme